MVLSTYCSILNDSAFTASQRAELWLVAQDRVRGSLLPSSTAPAVINERGKLGRVTPSELCQNASAWQTITSDSLYQIGLSHTTLGSDPRVAYLVIQSRTSPNEPFKRLPDYSIELWLRSPLSKTEGQ
jgi:hypothetical protein